MSLQNIYFELSKEMDDEYYTELARTEVLLIPVIIDKIYENPVNSFYAEGLLEKISKVLPKLVYPYFSYIAEILNLADSVNTWNVWRIIANLISCDIDNVWDSVREKYFSALKSNSVVEFSIACDCAEKVVASKPNDKDAIIDILNNIGSHKYLVAGEESVGSLEVAKQKANELLEKL